MSTLQITDLHASVVTDAGETAILKGVDLTAVSYTHLTLPTNREV